MLTPCFYRETKFVCTAWQQQVAELASDPTIIFPMSHKRRRFALWTAVICTAIKTHSTLLLRCLVEATARYCSYVLYTGFAINASLTACWTARWVPHSNAAKSPPTTSVKWLKGKIIFDHTICWTCTLHHWLHWPCSWTHPAVQMFIVPSAISVTKLIAASRQADRRTDRRSFSRRMLHTLIRRRDEVTVMRHE